MAQERWEERYSAELMEEDEEGVLIKIESEDSEGSNEEQNDFIEVQGARSVVKKMLAGLPSVSGPDSERIHSTGIQTTFVSPSEYQAIYDLSETNDHPHHDNCNSPDLDPQDKPEVSVTDNEQPPGEVVENLTSHDHNPEVNDSGKNSSNSPLWYIPLQEKLHRHGFVIPYGQLIPRQSLAWKILTHEEKGIFETQYYGCEPRMDFREWETLDAARKKSIRAKRQKKIKKAFQLAERQKGKEQDSAVQTIQKTAENDIRVSTKVGEDVVSDTFGARKREYFGSVEEAESDSDGPPRTKRKTCPVSAVPSNLNDTERGSNNPECNVPPGAGTQTDGRLDVYQRITLNMVGKKQKNMGAENAPSSVEIIKFEPQTGGSDNLNRENHHVSFDVHSFFAAHRYTNPPVMDALRDSGFSKYELLTMKGQKKHEVMDRFKAILPENCCRQAQLESLSHVVSSASMESWNKLENASG